MRKLLGIAAATWLAASGVLPAQAVAAPATTSARPLLRQGSRGPAVVTLQKLLGSRGFSPGPIDGIFGPRTATAVRGFQASRRLLVDGIVGPKTWGALTSNAPPRRGGSRPSGSAPPAAHVEMLIRIVQGECPPSVPRAGCVAVAAVVLTRAKTRRQTIAQVISAPYQFSSYRDSNYRGPIRAYARAAARAALAGENPCPGATHFFNPYLVKPSWARNLRFIRRIGTDRTNTHDFYR